MAESRAETVGRVMAHSPAETQSRREAAPWPKVRLGAVCDVFTGKKDVNQTVATGAYRLSFTF